MPAGASNFRPFPFWGSGMGRGVATQRVTGGRLGVDIGGTFTDVALEKDGRRFSAKILTTPEAPERAVHRGDPRGVAGCRARARRPVADHPRHDARHQRDHRAQGRQDRARHHRGLPRHGRDPPRKPLRAVRRQYRPAAALGAAALSLCRAGAAQCAGPRRRAARRRRGRTRRRAPRRRADRKRRDRLSAQLHQPGARNPHPRHPRRPPARRQLYAVFATCRPRCANTSASRPPAPTPTCSRCSGATSPTSRGCCAAKASSAPCF